MQPAILVETQNQYDTVTSILIKLNIKPHPQNHFVDSIGKTAIDIMGDMFISSYISPSTIGLYEIDKMTSYKDFLKQHVEETLWTH